MKKVVKGFLLVILLVGFSYSLSAVSECYDGRHGVEIDGSCYYCNDEIEYDGVCPSWYGADCTLAETNADQDCGGSGTQEGEAYWASFYELDGDIYGEVVTEAEIQLDSGDNYFYAFAESPEISVGDEITFTIKREGVISDPLIATVAGSIDEAGVVYAEWIPEKGDFPNNGQVGESAEFFFNAKEDGSDLDLDSGNLKLTVVSGDSCMQVQECGDYEDEASCGASLDENGDVLLEGDFCGMFYSENPMTVDGCAGMDYNFCLWDGTQCNLADYFVPNEEGSCNPKLCQYAASEVSGECGQEGVEEITVTYSPLETGCEPRQQTYTCPSLVELPFFTMFNVIIAILVIVGVYFYLHSRKKISKKRR